MPSGRRDVCLRPEADIGRTEILQCSDVLAVGCLSEIQNN